MQSDWRLKDVSLPSASENRSLSAHHKCHYIRQQPSPQHQTLHLLFMKSLMLFILRTVPLFFHVFHSVSSAAL